MTTPDEPHTDATTGTLPGCLVGIDPDTGRAFSWGTGERLPELDEPPSQREREV